MVAALVAIIIAFGVADRWPDARAGQHRRAVGPDRLGRHHRDRHGADHRVAQHRPVGRLDRRRRLDGLRPADDRHPAEAPRVRQPVAVGHRARTRPRRRRGARRLPGLHHRLHRRAVLHRHARRPARLPRRRLAAVAGRLRLRARPGLPAPRRRSGGFAWSGPELDRRRADLPDDRRIPHLQPAAAAQVRVQASTDVGRGAARHHRLWRRDRTRRLRERLPVAGGARQQVGAGPRGPGAAPAGSSRASPSRSSSSWS